MDVQRHTSINPTGLIIGVTLVVLLTKISSFLTPYKIYFSFSSFFIEDASDNRWIALTIKLVIPIIVGFILFAVPFFWLLRASTTRLHLFLYYRYLARQATVTAVAACVAAALLQAWPFIQYWDVLMRPDYGDVQLPFMVAYALYLVSYGYFAQLGIYLAKIAYRSHLPRLETEEAIAGVGWLELIRTTVVGAIPTALATLYTGLLQLPGQGT